MVRFILSKLLYLVPTFLGITLIAFSFVRILPGVMGNELSGAHESFEDGLLEYPHYTRPQEFEGRPIPGVLTSGNHARIAAWRRERAVELTRMRRPELLSDQG